MVYNLLKYLSLNCECDLVIFDELGNSAAKLQAEFPTVRSIRSVFRANGAQFSIVKLINVLKHRYPPSIYNYANPQLSAWLELNGSPRNYDLVHFDMFYMAQYRKYCESLPTVLVASDAYSMGLQSASRVGVGLERVGLAVRRMLFLRYERSEYGAFTKVCTVSERDSQYLRSICPPIDVETIGIAVSPEFLDPRPEDSPKVMSDKPRLLVTGLLSLPWVARGTLEFIDRVYPVIQSSVPDVDVTVWGRDPVPEVRRRLSFHGLITHVGYVENYLEFLRRDWIFVYPQQCGSGLQTKVQQAMAFGLPVVGFRVAFEGLNVMNQVHCFICDSYPEMAEAILTLLKDPTRRTSIGTSAARHIRENFSIPVIGRKMLDLYTYAIKKHRRQGIKGSVLS